MPVRLRTLGPNLIVAGYWFSEKEDEPEKFDWPWLHEPLRNNNLCANCSCLNFTWLFTHGLSGHTIDIDDRSTKLSDGICLGVYKDILKRSRCQFCKLVVHALEYAADVEMLNQYDDWPEQEVWINNHFFDARGMVVMVPAEHAYKCIARLGIRLKSATEDNLIFLHGGRRVMIQEIRSDFSSAAGMRLSRDSEALVQTIKNWTRFCQLRSPRHTPLQTYNGSIRLVDTYNQCITGPIAMTSIDHYVALR